MFRVVEVKALPEYRIWVRYEDGVEGEVDLSALVGQGVFSFWEDPAAFERVNVGSSGSVAWSEEIELCPDSIYLRLTSKQPEEIFPKLRPAGIDA